MGRDPLDRGATPERVRALGDALPPEAIEAALIWAARPPEGAAWWAFLVRALGGLGALSAVAGVVFFFAYNWAALGRLTKLGLLAALVAGAAAAALRLGLHRASGRGALTAASALVGPLLAVYGQAYQTGADPFELFLGWAALVTPWTVLARFAPLWLLWLALVEVGLLLFWEQVLDPRPPWIYQPLAHAALGAAAFAAWEALAPRPRWPVRTVACAALVPLTIAGSAAVMSLDEAGGGGALALAACAAAAVVIYLRYRIYGRDLFLLALGLLATGSVLTCGIGRLVFRGHDALADFLVMAVIVIAETALAARWLRALHRGWEDEA